MAMDETPPIVVDRNVPHDYLRPGVDIRLFRGIASALAIEAGVVGSYVAFEAHGEKFVATGALAIGALIARNNVRKR